MTHGLDSDCGPGWLLRQPGNLFLWSLVFLQVFFFVVVVVLRCFNLF